MSDDVRRGLDEQLAAMLADLSAQGYGLGRLPLAEERIRYRELCRELSATPPPEVTTRDWLIDTDDPDAPLPARLYIPGGSSAPGPGLVFFHGGGGVIGDVDGYDPAVRTLAATAGVRILSVDYRLAPEHPFPAGFLDAATATAWAFAHAGELGIDPARIGVGGDSQGGAMAAMTAIRERAHPIAFQFLIYPGFSIDPVKSADLLEGYFLDMGALVFFGSHIGMTGHPQARDFSPFRKELQDAPPAYVATAGFDPASPAMLNYVAALQAAGVPVIHRDFPRLIHGFLTMTAASVAAGDAVTDMARALHDGLRSPR